MTTDTLLIEIGTEELPPHHLGNLARHFEHNLAKALSEIGIQYEKSEHFASPRRLAARFVKVPAMQENRQIQKRGPALAAAFDAKGNPTQAAMGFAKSCGIDVSLLSRQETPQGTWLTFTHQEPGKPLVEVLPSLIENALNLIPAKKRMRWGSSLVEFLRPIHWIAAIHGQKALPIQVFSLKADNKTHGHRVHHPEAITINHADNYEAILKDAKVIANCHERQELINSAIKSIAEKNHGFAVVEEKLLDEVSGLVEWPVPLFAHFDKVFLEVPQEALISSMQNHQKCFAIKDNSGKLLPTFILISNTDCKDTHNIIRGNERVMHARLADAKFFYDQDRKTPLVSRCEGLKNMVFQKKLGTLYDKSQRIAKLAGQIAKLIDAPYRLAERAGKLCKADLLTEMVFEFPELQGIMGSYYARNDGEPEEVAHAIMESYLPKFAKDALPDSITGICVALADRLDTLIGIFGIGQIPTGDKDPFALRRQALAILRTLIEKALPLELDMLCEMARHGYGSLIDEEVIPKVLTFCFERFRAWYLEQGISPQTLDAVLANNIKSPFDASRRVMAVSHFQTLNEAQNLASANKRVRNILQKSGVIVSLQQLPKINAALLKEPAEIALYDAISSLKTQTDPMILEGAYQEALIALATLQQPVDTFFNDVMVMTEDETLKQNRIHLLCHLHALFMQIADISKLAL